MRRREVLRAAAIGPLIGRWGAITSAAAPANAADSYREAARAMPERSEADDAIVIAAVTATLDEAAAGLVRRSARALELLGRGASIAGCDWGDTWTGPGFATCLDLVGDFRRLAKLAALRARFAVEVDRNARGLDDAVSGLTLGRHLARGGVLIAQLVGFAIEHVAIEAVAVGLARLDPQSLKGLVARFAALPTMLGPAEAIRAERAYFLGYVVPTQRQELDLDDARIAQWLAWLDRVAAAYMDPKALDEVRSQAKAGSDEKRFFESFDAYLGARTYVEVKRALFLGSIAVTLHGPDALGKTLDPADGRPFAHRARDNGFELTSRFINFKGIKASLVVGRP